MFKENLVFLREFLLEFKTTGACFPTSRWAAQVLITPLRASNRGPKNILELGPGTGSVTLPLLKELRPGDHLTICEINPRFMKMLKDTLEADGEFQRVKNQVSFFLGAAQDLPNERIYDIIVCALPFVNFDLETVQAIFSKLRDVSTQDTLMTYYEYIGVRRFNETIGAPERRDRIAQVHDYLKQSGYISYLKRERVWLNLFPINIYTVRPAEIGRAHV
jgi:phospholipid N-methyltransferase